MAPRPKRSNQTQNPVIEHGEKAAFGVLVLVLGYAVYGAITHPTYEKRPEQLRVQAESKLTAINNARPDDEFKKQFPVENFAAMVDAANQPIKPQEFAITTPFYIDRTAVLGEKRGQPELLPAVELSARFVRMSIATNPTATPTQSPMGTTPMGPATAGGRRGPMASAAPVAGAEGGEGVSSSLSYGSGTVPKGKMAIVVVGRVPVQEQLLKYQQAFQNSRFSDPERDVPFYVTFLLERADVTHNPENPQWTSVVDGQSLIVANLLEMNEWAGTAPEIVDQTHVRPLQLDQATGAWSQFTSPLPPRLLEEWSSEVTCKSIKKLEPIEDPQLAAAGTQETQQQVTVPMGGNPFAANPFQAGGLGLPQTNRPTTSPADQATRRTTNPQQKEGMSDILLRFFDFKVEPNHRYQYRVKLVLRNPNFNLPDRYLKDPSLAKAMYVFSPDSEPTPAVAVSGYSEVLAGGVEPPRGISEATATVIIRNRDADTGAIVAYEFPGVERGTLLNFEVVKKTVRGKTVGALMPNPATSKVTVAEHAVFKSNELLLDMRGGEVLPSPPNDRRVKETSGVLVLDENGWLHVRGEFANLAEPFREEKTRLDMLAASLEPEAKAAADGAEGAPAESGNSLGGRAGGSSRD